MYHRFEGAEIINYRVCFRNAWAYTCMHAGSLRRHFSITGVYERQNFPPEHVTFGNR